MPDLIESLPRSGPTVLSSAIIKGVGKAPDLSNKERSVADWNVKLPDIVPLPVVIESWITGALITSLSKKIAILFPILFVVALPNLWPPTLSNENATIGWLFRLSNLGCASIKFSPLIIILLLTEISSCVFLIIYFFIYRILIEKIII